ncbi:hypothetical protein B0H63DRAFT_565013 [Podospora didyma]|uniref:Uncharacterized protein n=1 Tax=Podospora didyma TaxID=330526 RepID=A0AAE0K1E9_9PEZI|nr:hypothetical protein B0H63DRAFT_565013 [Podospora didyma]
MTSKPVLKSHARYSPVHPADEDPEDEELLLFRDRRKILFLPKRLAFFYSKSHILALYGVNLLLIILLVCQWVFLRRHDPSLGIYSPANGAVEYIEKMKLRPALFNLTEYMGYPTSDGRTDELWSNLYNFGISKISKAEAKKLVSPTVAIPGTEDYLIQLDVWHELHCLNGLRKLLYPEVYGGLGKVTRPDGTIDRGSAMFHHWDHCVDLIRQTLMCHADISPIPFHVNAPKNTGILPRLQTTHTCRNFERIQQWARDHSAGEWDFNVNPEKAQEIIEASGFDNSNEEGIYS